MVKDVESKEGGAPYLRKCSHVERNGRRTRRKSTYSVIFIKLKISLRRQT